MILGGWVFLMSEVPLWRVQAGPPGGGVPQETSVLHAGRNQHGHFMFPSGKAVLQGNLAHKKPPPPWDRHRSLGMVLL